jgi:hypothetical protein
MRFVVVLVVIGSGHTLGCSANSGSQPTGPVSFKQTVLPLFEQSCGIGEGACHGEGLAPGTGRPFLGNHAGGTDPAMVLMGIVNQPSSEDPQLDIVKASDPDNSYLIHKLDGDQVQFSAECAKATQAYPMCGSQMPYTGMALDQSTIDSVRQWIAQGAQNN